MWAIAELSTELWGEEVFGSQALIRKTQTATQRKNGAEGKIETNNDEWAHAEMLSQSQLNPSVRYLPPTIKVRERY